MTTIDHTATDHPQYPDARRRDVAEVVDLAAHRALRRLRRLVDARRRLARTVAEQRSHELDEAREMLDLQVTLESLIAEEFPDEYEELFPGWVDEDATAEHAVGAWDVACGICRTVKTDSGPPSAA